MTPPSGKHVLYKVKSVELNIEPMLLVVNYTVISNFLNLSAR